MHPQASHSQSAARVWPARRLGRRFLVTLTALGVAVGVAAGSGAALATDFGGSYSNFGSGGQHFGPGGHFGGAPVQAHVPRRHAGPLADMPRHPVAAQRWLVNKPLRWHVRFKDNHPRAFHNRLVPMLRDLPPPWQARMHGRFPNWYHANIARGHRLIARGDRHDHGRGHDRGRGRGHDHGHGGGHVSAPSHGGGHGGGQGARRCVNPVGTLAGAALGGFIGSQFGKGDGKLAATAAGTFFGSQIGGSAGCR